MALTKKKCPYCKSTNIDSGVAKDYIGYYCVDCGRSWREDKKKGNGNKSGYKEKISNVSSKLEGFNISGGLIKTIAFTIITLILFFVNPYIEAVNSSMFGILSAFIPGLADYWDMVVIAGALLITAAGAIAVWHYDSLLLAIVIVIGIVAVMIFLPMIAPYAESVGVNDYLSSLTCMLQNLGNPEGMSSCYVTTPDYNDLDSEKIGNYDVVDISFDTEYTGRVIYKTKDNEGSEKLNFNTYYINLIVENPSDTDTIEDFCIVDNDLIDLGDKDTALIRGGSVRSSEKIKLGSLVTSDGKWMCSNCESGNCDIAPNEKIRLVLKVIPINCSNYTYSQSYCEYLDYCEWIEGDEELEEESYCTFDSDSRTNSAEAKVTFRYDYAGEGEFDFVIGNSEETVKILTSSRNPPTSSDGPIDVVVYFSPNALVIYGTEQDTVNTLVKLTNEKSGTATVNGLSITRLTSGVLTAPTSCEASWGTAELSSSGLSQSSTFSKPLKDGHLYVCEYGIIDSEVGEDGEVIPFIARTDYTYEDSKTLKSIDVYEEDF